MCDNILQLLFKRCSLQSSGPDPAAKQHIHTCGLLEFVEVVHEDSVGGAAISLQHH